MFSHSILFRASKSASSSPAHLLGSTVQVSGSASLAVVKSFDRGNFCNLCKEPFGQWNEHRGKRDHISLELFFNVIAEHARAWKCEQVLWDYQDRFDPTMKNQKILDDELLRLRRMAGSVEQAGEKEYLTNPRLVQRAQADRKRKKMMIHRARRRLLEEKENGEEASPELRTEIARLLTSERKLSRDLSRYDSDRMFAGKKFNEIESSSSKTIEKQSEELQRRKLQELPTDRLALRSLFRFSDDEQKQRRTRSFAIMKYLQEEGVIYLGPNQWKDSKLNKINMGHNGALVLFWMQHPQIIHLFPKADAAQIASFSQVCYSMYSLETVFDFFGMGELIDIREIASPGASQGSAKESSSNSSLNRTTINASVEDALLMNINNNINNNQSTPSPSPASSVIRQGIAQNTNLLDPHSSSDFTYDLTWFDKSIIIRNILGQIRWAMSGFGHQINHPIAQKCDPHIEVLCEELAHNIITETLFCRTCEFVCRADKVWREMGCPTGDTTSEGMSVASAAMKNFTGTVRDVNKFGSMFVGKSVTSTKSSAKKSLSASSSSDESTSIYSAAAPASSQTTSASSSSSSSVFFPSALPGTNNHLPMSATENAVQMINSCYHNGMSSLLGRDNGDCNFRNGGEYQTDVVRSMRYTQDLKKMSLDALKKQNSFRKEQEVRAKEAEKERLLRQKMGSKKLPFVKSSSKMAPLSATAEKLLRDAAIGVEK